MPDFNPDCVVEGCEREAIDASGYCKKHKQPPTATDEWTTEPVRKRDGTIWEGLAYINLPDGRGLGSVNAEQAKAICNSHNAALAALDDKWRDRFRKFGAVVMKEKETEIAAANRKYKPQVLQDSEARVEELEQQLAVERKRYASLTWDMADLRRELAAEREKRVQIITPVDTQTEDALRQQLLAAQTAIAKHNKLLNVLNRNMCIDVDLSALDKHDAEVREEAEKRWDEWHKFTDEGLAKHDAEVREERDKWWRERTSSERVLRLENERKPLVDALEQIGENKLRQGDAIWMRDLAADALAKVKLK